MLKYFFKELPELVQTQEIKTVEDMFFILMNSFPGNVSSLINWIAEVKRSSTNLEHDEALRLECKVTILEQLRRTKLHMLVSGWMKSTGCACPVTMSEDVARACYDGAAVLCGCCHTWHLRCEYTMKTNRDTVGATAAVNEPKKSPDVQVDVLVPTALSDLAKCEGLCLLHPASADLLCVVLLALPVHTWEGIKSSDVKATLYSLLSCAGLSSELEEEIQHVKRQLQLLSCELEG